MLRESLQVLADHLAKYQDTGIVMEPAALAAILAVLESCIEQAGVLEEAAQRHFQGHGLPEDVVKIATLLARNGVSAGLPRKEGAA